MGIIHFQKRIFERIQEVLLFDWISITVVGMGLCRAAVAVG